MKIPAYDIMSITLGFYVGYNEGKGNDMGPAKEYLLKYGPTALAMTVTTPNIMFLRYTSKKTRELVFNDIKPDDLQFKEKQKFVDNLEQTLNRKPNYIKNTVRVGFKTAAETFTGYVAGRVVSII